MARGEAARERIRAIKSRRRLRREKATTGQPTASRFAIDIMPSMGARKEKCHFVHVCALCLGDHSATKCTKDKPRAG